MSFYCYFFYLSILSSIGASLVAQRVKHLLAMQETRVRFLGRKNPLEKEMAIHSSTLAWKIPWMEKPGRLQVHGVTKSQTRLSNFTLSSVYYIIKDKNLN